MVSMPLARPPRLATKALRNSIANTAASLANLQCGTFEHFFLWVLRNSNWSVVSESTLTPTFFDEKFGRKEGFGIDEVMRGGPARASMIKNF